jgi:Tol biopolymer transport system component
MKDREGIMPTRTIVIRISFLIAAVSLMLAQTGDDLFKQARNKEVVDADIPGAIELYERVVREFPANRALVAQSLLQLGECYERLNQPAKSREAFQRIVAQYKDQADVYARAAARLAPAPDTRKRVEIKTPFSWDPIAFALSPDGKTLVALASQTLGGQLWLYHLDTGKSELLPGTENPHNCCGQTPFFSPEGRSIGFFAEGKLKTIDLQSRRVRVLAAAPFPQGGAWSQDDTIVFSSTLFAPLKRLSALVENGPVESLAAAVGRPHFLPDGRRFLFYARVSRTPILRIGSLDNADVQTLSVNGPSGASFVSPNHLFYTGGGSFFHQPLDPLTLQAAGSPERLADSVATFGTSLGTAAFSASASGPVAYRTGLVATRRFTWWDRKGQRVGFLGAADKEDPAYVRFSPNGRSLSFTRQAPVGNSGPFVGLTQIDVATGRLSGMETPCAYGVWSPSGESLSCDANQIAQGKNAYNLFIHTVGGGTRPMRPPAQGFNTPVDWSPDGKFVLYTYYDVDGSGGRDLLAQPVDGGAAVPVAATSAFEVNGRFSPNGHWVAYDSYESGKGFEIYVQPFPGSTASRLKVSVNGGYDPQWSRDGKELYFLSSDNHLMVVPVTFSTNGTELKTGTPAALFEATLPAGSEYAPAPDGQRFLVNSPIEDLPPIVVLSNWEAK